MICISSLLRWRSWNVGEGRKRQNPCPTGEEHRSCLDERCSKNVWNTLCVLHILKLLSPLCAFHACGPMTASMGASPVHSIQ